MIRDLGDGLVLRCATDNDAEPLAVFVGDVLRVQDSAEPNRALTAWERDLIGGRHPSFRPQDACSASVGCGRSRPRSPTASSAPRRRERCSTRSSRKPRPISGP